MANLLELFDNVVEFQNYNGTPLAAGKMYVYALGRTRLMDTWSDIDGESLNPNPIILDDLGQCHCYVSDAFDYTIVVCDQFNNEIFSVDKYLLSKGEHSHADVAVAPSEHIGVSSYHVGEVTVYVPYLTGEVGKTYEGIDPIVVNNTLNRISANHIPLGVQDPLYFVEDSETACIIGFSGTTPVPEGTMNESAFGYEDGQITSYNGSAFSAGNTYEEGSYVSIDNNTISVTGLQPAGDYAYNSALSSKLDVTALPQDLVHTDDLTAYQPVGDYQTAGNYYSASNPSGFINSDAISSMATTGFVADVSADITAMIPTALTGDYLTKESADTLYQPTGNYQSALDFGYVGSEISSINGSGIYTQGGTANPQIPVTSTSGISIFESGDKVYFNISGDYATNTDLQTVSGEITALIPTALTGEYLDKASADTLYYPLESNPSGYLTAHQDLSDYQTTAGMTAYQPVGDYLTTGDSANFYTTANESGFITGVDLTPYQTVEGMTAYQPVGDYYSASNPSGFLTAHQSLEGYLQDSDLGITDNKITAISGVELSAGDELPATVMDTSGLEYNSQGFINGYNGSAVATIDQERQWFTHDDTLCHVSNSAQYALGVNMSAISADLARMMGVDETVLYSGTSDGSQTIPLTESVMNFDRIRIYAKLWNDGGNSIITEFDPSVDLTTIYSDTFTTNPVRFINGNFNFSALTAFTLSELTYANASWSTIQLDKRKSTMYKVVGIHRISGGI